MPCRRNATAVSSARARADRFSAAGTKAVPGIRMFFAGRDAMPQRQLIYIFDLVDALQDALLQVRPATARIPDLSPSFRRPSRPTSETRPASCPWLRPSVAHKPEATSRRNRVGILARAFVIENRKSSGICAVAIAAVIDSSVALTNSPAAFFTSAYGILFCTGINQFDVTERARSLFDLAGHAFIALCRQARSASSPRYSCPTFCFHSGLILLR